jgi:hypothetical protein
MELPVRVTVVIPPSSLSNSAMYVGGKRGYLSLIGELPDSGSIAAGIGWWQVEMAMFII